MENTEGNLKEGRIQEPHALSGLSWRALLRSPVSAEYVSSTVLGRGYQNGPGERRPPEDLRASRMGPEAERP